MFFTKLYANNISKIVVSEVSKVIEKFQKNVLERFKVLEFQLEQIDTNVKLLEKKIIIKDMSDQRNYGNIQYKLAETSSSKMKNEIEALKENLNILKDDINQ